ncbi:MAG: hypothetical protein IPN90_02970 [Elusimicrobia bacterium]|nr:hypothetical protein [Elusimicrobiota bacterium]
MIAAISVAAKPPSGIAPTDYLGKPVGARFIGMGEVGAALSGSSQSPVYNPASLGEVTRPSFSADFQMANQSSLPQETLLNSSSLRGKKLTYLGFASKGTAFFYRPLANYDTLVTSTTDPENNYVQNYLRVNQYGFSASQETEKGYSVGLGLSYIGAQRGYAKAETGVPPVLEMADGNGFALDVGFRDKKGDVAYGLSVLNAVGLIYWDKYDTDQLPLTVRAGLGFQPVPVFGFYTDYEKRYFTGETPDIDYWHFGIELAAVRWLVLRTGAVSEDFNNQEKTSFSWGFTFGNPRSYSLDASSKTRKVQGERVNQFDLSIVLPLPSKE